MTDLPKITIGIVTYNRKRYLQRTLDYVLADPYPNKEIIVVDGGSQDGTKELLESYGNRLTRWVSEKDKGEYDAWNKLNRLATGDILKWLPDDDKLRHGACDFAAAWFAQHPEVDMLWGQTVTYIEREFGNLQWLSETHMTDPAQLSKHHFLRQTHGVTSVALFVRRRVVDRLGPFRTDMACADTEYWVRAADRGVVMGLVPEIFVDYTITGDNGQIKYAFKISRDVLRINRMYGTQADVLYTIWQRRTSISGLTMLAHRLGQEAGKRNLHPLRTLRSLRAKIFG